MVSAWIAVLLLGLAAFVGGVVGGPDVQAVVAQAMGWVAVMSMFIGSRRLTRREQGPWLGLAAGTSAMLVAGITREVHGRVVGVVDPFPSYGDLFYVVGYLIIIAGLVNLIRLRTVERLPDDNIDALIVMVAFGLFAWASVLAPYVRDGEIPGFERLLAVVYSLLTMVLVAVITRLAVGPGLRSPAYYFLAVAGGFLFLIDALSTVATTADFEPGLALMLAPLPAGFAAVAALHPSMRRLTERPAYVAPHLTFRRFLLLAAALLAAPVVLGIQLAFGNEADVPVVVTGSVLLSVLVLARLSSLVKASEQAAERERVLRDMGLDLVAASSMSDTNRIALGAVIDLTKGLPAGRATVLSREAGGFVVSAATGRLTSGLVGTRIDDDSLREDVRAGLTGRRAVVLEQVPAIDIDSGGDVAFQATILVAPLVSRDELRGALVVTSAVPLGRAAVASLSALAAQVSLAIESAALAEDLHRRRGERRFRSLVENSSDLIVVFDEWGRGTFASPVAERLLGRPESYFLGPMPVEFVHPHDQTRFASLLRSAAERVVDDPLEVRFLHGDGAYRWFEVRIRDLRSEPEIAGLVVNARDITDRKAAEQRLARSEARFRALVQNSSDVVAVIDEQGFLSYVSPAAEPMLGYRADELVGSNVLRLLPADEVGNAMRLLGSLTEASFSQQNLELRLRDRDGAWHHVDVTISDLRGEPAVQGIVLNARDVTLRRALEEDLEHRSLHDELTGLVNRVTFSSRVARALGRSEPRLDQVGVLFIDLDDFKEVNDSLGHHVGDQLIIAVAERVRGCLRVADVASRLGGDEFAVLLEDTYGESEILAVAERILASIARPYVVDGHEITVTASVGVAIDPDRSEAPEALLRSADVAMYLAKEKGKNRFEVFREDAHAGAFERLELKAALLRAIHEQELVLHYQPIVELATGRVVGCEALVRWLHPTRGLLGPGAFIPLAEETGLIVPLGSWVLEESCRQLAEWRSGYAAAADLRVSVNLSVRQLEQGDIVSEVGKVLQDAHLPADHLTLEITESLVMHDANAVRDRLVDLRALGVSLAVDDFGTGYSSLGYIQRFPVDIIKIDRSFVEQIDRGGIGVVRTIVDLAAGLDAAVVAEGIEESIQHDVLTEMGCEFGQGFLFSRPVPAVDFAQLLRGDVAAIPAGT